MSAASCGLAERKASVPPGATAHTSSGAQSPAPLPPREPATVLPFTRQGLDVALTLLSSLFDARILQSAQAAARRNGTCPLRELVLSGAGDETAIYAALAEACGLAFDADPKIVPWRPGSGEIPIDAGVVCALADGEPTWFCAPDARQVAAMARERPERMTIVPPSKLVKLIERSRSGDALAIAVHGLHRERPDASARTVLAGAQGIVLAAAFALLVLALVQATSTTWLMIHTLATLAFASCVGLRCAAAVTARPPVRSELPANDPADLPVYTVLATLYREAEVVPQLIAHLGALQWPRAKLDIRFVCEADDRETLDAIAAHGLAPNMRVVEVPALGPRTKPKALGYALETVRGDYVVVFDAEDRPHPYQLLEAHAAFERGSDDLACVQAPLQVDNGYETFFSRGFAIEYAALFRGLLPWLAERGLPIPLGGTSNHFRTDALRAVGGWDAFNVTEDADLGFRLYRNGYTIDTITRPTLEAAPTRWRVWRNQRTRWLKGWAQTWLVHMREPRRLARDLGPKGFVVFQIATLGVLASVLLHPLMFVALVPTLLAMSAGLSSTGYEQVLLTLDLANVLLAYAATALLASAVLRPEERWLLRGAWWRGPLYWLALGVPAWRAMAELVTAPHHWSKTPHTASEPARGAGTAATVRT